jgi:hypothetical protein
METNPSTCTILLAGSLERALKTADPPLMRPSPIPDEGAHTTTLAPDGFPVSIADRDCQIQIDISDDIQHAPIARAEYEQRYAPTNYAARMRDRLTDEKLYPKLTQATSGSWVLAIARRLEEVVKTEGGANPKRASYQAYLDLCATVGHTPVSSS